MFEVNVRQDSLGTQVNVYIDDVWEEGYFRTFPADGYKYPEEWQCQAQAIEDARTYATQVYKDEDTYVDSDKLFTDETDIWDDPWRDLNPVNWD